MKNNKSEHQITLLYSLANLPTAQHKAGLVGLLLCVEAMKEYGLHPLLEIEKLTADSVQLRCTEKSLQALFDYLYDAELVEISSNKKWPRSAPKREEKKKKEADKTISVFFYDIVQPKGAFWDVLCPDGNVKKIWAKMVWTILRSQHRAREVYDERVNGSSSSLGPKKWESLLKAEGNKRKGKIETEGIVGNLFIGAQQMNAEKVVFQGRVEENLLLHFWSLSSLIYTPRTVNNEGKYTYRGYVLAIPEPSDLEWFLEDMKSLLLRMEATEYRGRYPPAMCIDLPEEGGLEFLYHLARHRIEKKDIAYSLSSVELYHMEKQGKICKMLASEHLVPDRNIIERYEKFRGLYYNPFFKGCYIRNLLRGEPWYQDMATLLDTISRHYFIPNINDFNLQIPSFGQDVRKKFEETLKRTEIIDLKGELKVKEIKQEDDSLAIRIYQMIRTYVNQKSEEKSGKKYEEFKTKKDANGWVIYPPEYLKARQKICGDAFLAMRGRREQDFIEYFTGTVCAVPQYLPEKDFSSVTEMLINEWEKVKVLSMLALSANAYQIKTKT